MRGIYVFVRMFVGDMFGPDAETEGCSMTTRKPKLNLLYVSATETPWLQLAVVTPDNGASMKHARHWQGALHRPEW